MVQEKSGNNAKKTNWKQSDQKELDTETKIILVLKHKQPLTAQEICRHAQINVSTFYRHYRIMEQHQVLKKVDNGYALWEYEKRKGYWQKVYDRMLVAGGVPINLEVQKLTLGDEDKITGWYKRIFDKQVAIEGIVIPNIATELIEAAKIDLNRKDPFSGESYVAALITRDSLDSGDRFNWQRCTFVVWEIWPMYEGNDLSYYIMYLKYDSHSDGI